MRRREFITLLGGAAAAWPLTARAQEPGQIYRLGDLHLSPRNALYNVALFDAVEPDGFIDGKNLVVDDRGTVIFGHLKNAREFSLHLPEIGDRR